MYREMCGGAADLLWAQAESFTQPNNPPLAKKQEKVMYLICIVGTGYQQEEPCEGVVGWTWKTGFTSFIKEGKEKRKRQARGFITGRGTKPYNKLTM